MERKVFFKDSDGLNLCGIIDVPANPVEKLIVIFVHGHSSNKNTKNYVALKDILNKKGFTTFRIDLRGTWDRTSRRRIAKSTGSMYANV